MLLFIGLFLVTCLLEIKPAFAALDGVDFRRRQEKGTEEEPQPPELWYCYNGNPESYVDSKKRKEEGMVVDPNNDPNEGVPLIVYVYKTAFKSFKESVESLYRYVGFWFFADSSDGMKMRTITDVIKKTPTGQKH